MSWTRSGSAGSPPRCALRTPWSCEKGGRPKAYVEGHIPAATSDCFDAWSHVGREGTHRAMVLNFPESALLQGAEPYVRWRADDKQTRPEVAARMRTALLEWDKASTGVIRRQPFPLETAERSRRRDA